MNETVLLEKQGPVARLTLNRPDKHNSLGETELQALQSHLAGLRDSEARVLIVTGAGEKTFCAGAALNQLGAGDISGELFQETTNKLAQLPVPTICALNGSVFGGGVELALSCDFRIGISGTRMRVPAAQIGLCYPPSGIQRFVERLGTNLTKRILIAAEEFDADDMLRLGFLDHLEPRDGLLPRAEALAENIAGLAPLSVRSMKEVVQRYASGLVDAEEVQDLYQRCLQSADLQEGFAAQREKRSPRFKGC